MAKPAEQRPDGVEDSPPAAAVVSDVQDPARAQSSTPSTRIPAGQAADLPARTPPMIQNHPGASGRRLPSRSRLVTAGVAAAVVVAGSLWWHDRTAAETEQAAPAAAGVATVRITAPETSRKSAGAGIGSDALPSASSTAAGSRPEKSRQPVRETSPPSATATTPAQPKAAVNTTGANLALNRPAMSSSVEGSAWASSNAVDGDGESRWSSAFSDPQWLRVDLGQPWEISSIRVRWERAYAVAYRMEVSTDGQKWKSVYGTTNGEGGDVTIEVAQVPARFVRMYGTKRSGQYGYSLLELEVS